MTRARTRLRQALLGPMGPAVLAAGLVVSACAGSGSQVAAPGVAPSTRTATQVTPGVPAPTAAPDIDVEGDVEVAPGPPAFGTPLPPATGIPAALRRAEPVALRIRALGIETARVLPVGVLPSGEMEIPPAREVGWYRYGPVPGDQGSAVLAAHIAGGGVDGVFRHLARLEPGDLVEVTDADGTVGRFEVFETSTYRKQALPTAELFAKSGPALLSLISCGGSWDRDRQSYDSNVVVVARPMSSGEPPAQGAT